VKAARKGDTPHIRDNVCKTGSGFLRPEEWLDVCKVLKAKNLSWLGMVGHSSNSSTQESEVGRLQIQG
jgi:hypothetical protein